MKDGLCQRDTARFPSVMVKCYHVRDIFERNADQIGAVEVVRIVARSDAGTGAESSSKGPTRRLGYARVSTYGQALDAQLEQLRGAGCTKIYLEKVTGARGELLKLLKLLKGLAPGDVVTVTRIDRLARSTFDLFAIVKRIVDAKAQFRSLAEPWADTGTSTGRLMIAVLGGLADVERDLIRTRTAEGRSRAQKRGQHMGRPPKLTPAQKAEARRRRAQGATLAELARSYDVGKSTISRLTA
jgi:DNA invertase Pin-like site-specific DNA recombinase